MRIEYEQSLEQAVLDDWGWLLTEVQPDQLAPYHGQHIAVVNRQILGSDKESEKLLDAVCRQHHLHPERVVITYID